VVAAAPSGNPSVSLHRVHVILQDNFPDSCLCKLFNLFLDCHPKVQSKTIVF
jgi:hypothetical protein